MIRAGWLLLIGALVVMGEWRTASVAHAADAINVEIHSGQCSAFLTDAGRLITVCLVGDEEPTCRVVTYNGAQDGWYLNYRGEFTLPAGSVSTEDTTFPSLGCSRPDEPFQLTIRSDRKELYRWVYIPALVGGGE